jgi:hypothetical protein
MGSDMTTQPTHSVLMSFRISLLPALLLGLGLAACSKAPEDTKESLAQNPERLRAVTKACHEDPKSTDERLCRAAADANFQKFMTHKPSVDEPGAKPSPVQPPPKF